MEMLVNLNSIFLANIFILKLISKKYRERKEYFSIYVFLISCFCFLQNNRHDFSKKCQNKLLKPAHS